MIDNVIPYIGGEEEKSEQEPLRVWGQRRKRCRLSRPNAPLITTQCIRVPVTDGHTAAVFVKFREQADPRGDSRGMGVTTPRRSAGHSGSRTRPQQFITYFEEPDQPAGRGSTAISTAAWASRSARLREDTLFDYKFVGLSHNTLQRRRGRRGPDIAELLYAGGVSHEMKQNILIVGGGGREHAIADCLKKSPDCGKLWCAPGNGGTAAICENLPIKATDVEGIVRAAKELKPDIVFVAPDDPLMLGMVDRLEEEGFRAFGPRQNAAIIEGSKVFSKELMKKYGIPTARLRGL